MVADGRLIFELKDLMSRLQIRLRRGLEMRLLGPMETGGAECLLVVLDIGEALREPVLSVRIPVSATVPGRNAGRQRDFQIALAEAFAELSMSSGLGLAAADWTAVAGAPTPGT